MKINLGCAYNKMESCINIDKSKLVNPDLVLDLEEGKLPFEDNSVEQIFAIHILEHIKNIIPLMNECYRVLQKGGFMKITVPQNEGTWADPTHVRAFSKLSFRYYCGYGFERIYGITCVFEQIKCEFIPNEDGGILEVVLRK